jgi:D-alanyl-D-alanine dipeptidase
VKRAAATLALALLCGAFVIAATPKPKTPALPAGFVYLHDVAPDVVQDIRYFGNHNFVGRPLGGYDAPACILTAQAARALAQVEAELLAANLTLRVYDCYRPQRASDDVVAWTKRTSDLTMKTEFYPNVDKARLLALGYVAAKSGHSRGSTVDLTIQKLPVGTPFAYVPGRHSCIAPYYLRYHDGGINMGTNYDCLDPLSHADADVGALAAAHRRLLHDVMKKHGFEGPGNGWWQFTLREEPYPNTYFNFPVTGEPVKP